MAVTGIVTLRLAAVGSGGWPVAAEVGFAAEISVVLGWGAEGAMLYSARMEDLSCRIEGKVACCNGC